MPNDHDRLICRLPEERRRNMLETIAATSRDNTVLVEHSYDRQLEGATLTVGRIIGVAYNVGGGSSDLLVVQPARTDRRMVAIPAARILRISGATPIHTPAMGDQPVRHGFRRGQVIAGPPRA